MGNVFKIETTVCLLSTRYFKSVIEIASIGQPLGYNVANMPAYYWKSLIKRSGILMTAFPMDWRSKKEVNQDDEYREVKLAIEAFDAPVVSLFVPNKLVKFLTESDSLGWIVNVHENREVRAQDVKQFAYIASSIQKDLTHAEIAKIKSINDFIYVSV